MTKEKKVKSKNNITKQLTRRLIATLREKK